MMRIRRALARDADILTDIAVASEAHWGGDTDFMDCFRAEYRVTADFIENNPVFLLDDEAEPVGFYGLIEKKGASELEYLYVKESRIGKGCGRILWNHILSTCRELGIRKIEFVTSPEAEAFYIRMGARRIAVVESTLKSGRLIPRLEYDIPKE